MASQAQSDDSTLTHGKFGIQVGAVNDHSRTEPTLQVTLGYDIDRTWSVEALANVSLLFMRAGIMKANDHEFNSALGARGLATLPLSDSWSLVAGLGLVQFSEDVATGTANVTKTKTSPIVSAAFMHRASRRWSFGAEISSFTTASSVNVGLKSELHF